MRTILLVILVLASPLLVGAAPLEEALEAYKQRDYPTAFKKFSQVAKGSESASVFLERAENKNPGMPREELVDYWRDNYGPDAKTKAHFYLGVLYEEGYGVPQNYAEAVGWYAKAAIAGEPAAESNLAIMYGEGRGVGKDLAQAFYWYTKAASHGDAAAMNNLGVMYATGQGTIQNYVFAHQWYNLSAAHNTDEEKRNIAATNRDALARKMTPMQISEAQHLASQWKPGR